jgi:tetratricopeptide (TPR) repeat protein
MLSVLIALVAGGLLGSALFYTTSLHPAISVAVGSVTFGLIYFLLMKQIMSKVNVLMEAAQKDIMANRAEKAVKTLEAAQKKYGHWQFYITKQMNSQIGMVYYLRKDFSKAFDYLKKGFVRHWVAQSMLGIVYMKRNQPAKMIDTFDKTVAGTRKEPLLWSIYAFCLEKIGERDKAIAVMQKGLKKVGSDELMQSNLEAIQNGKKMKMQPYGDLWFQFHLEKTGSLIRKQTKAVQGRRKIVRR